MLTAAIRLCLHHDPEDISRHTGVPMALLDLLREELQLCTARPAPGDRDHTAPAMPPPPVAVARPARPPAGPAARGPQTAAPMAVLHLLVIAHAVAVGACVSMSLHSALTHHALAAGLSGGAAVVLAAVVLAAVACSLLRRILPRPQSGSRLPAGPRDGGPP